MGDYSYQPCFGFVVKERDIAGNLNVEKCEQLEIPREHLATLKVSSFTPPVICD